MDARAACLCSRSISVASSSSSRSSRVNTAGVLPRAATPIRRRPIIAANAANKGDEKNLDLDFLLAPPDIDGDVASAYADAGGRFDVSA